jgi:hypothetical protein
VCSDEEDEIDSWGLLNTECTLDDGSEPFFGLEITCLFLFYYTEHTDTDNPNGGLIFTSRRWEFFLVISRCQTSGISDSAPIVCSDLERSTPAAYRRLGVGKFEVELVPKNQCSQESDQEYDNTSWPNPSLMFDAAQRVTIELV